MKQLKHFFLALGLLLSAGAKAQTPKLSIYLVSHNEDNIGYMNGGTGFMLYKNNRAKLVTIANIVKSKGLAYNYGSDYVALQAIAKYDTGTTRLTTGNKNLLRWMKEDMKIECDPHSHEKRFNYGDVAYMFTTLGVIPTNTMSGFLYNQKQNGHSWEDYQNGAKGDSFPTYTWHPEILWGAGSPNHVSDPNYFAVYRPTSMVSFSTHTASNHLILCGTGCALKMEDTSKVKNMMGTIRRTINALKNGSLPSNGIYMQEIFFSEGNVSKAWFIPLLNELTDSIVPLISSGAAEWKNIAAIVADWKTRFSNRPFAMDCNYNIVLENHNLSSIDRDFKVYPNPASGGILSIERQESTIVEDLSIYNSFGQLIFHRELSPGANKTILELDIRNYSPGMYVVVLGNKRRLWIKE